MVGKKTQVSQKGKLGKKALEAIAPVTADQLEIEGMFLANPQKRQRKGTESIFRWIKGR